MKVCFVGAGPGDPELLTLKGRRLLQECGCCIYAGSLVNAALLEFLSPGAERHDSAKLSLDEVTALYRRCQERDVNVVRLHSGDPSLFGTMGEQMRELDALGIAYEVVPGVSSFTAAAAALQAPLTAPEVSQTVILTRTAGRTPMPGGQDLDALARTKSTLCIFLSVHKVEEIAALLAVHYGADCPAAVVYRASWPDQKIVRGTLADIGPRCREAGIGKTALILAGPAMGRPATTSRLYDASFTHEFRRGDEA